MRPKFYWTISVVGVLCLYFITNLHADTSNQLNQLIRLKHDEASIHIDDLFPLDPQEASIQQYIKRYTRNGKRETQTLLGRAAFYFPIFEYYLQENGLPEALKYLPVVESNLRKEVISSRGAAGLWQFMPATARYYGLEVNESKDERLDPHKASEAAAKMLLDLHHQFDDWLLALAAYNCGPGRVRKAIRKAGTRDFQKLRRYLPLQTRNYANKLLAAIHVGENYQQYELVPKQNEYFNQQILQELLIPGDYAPEALAKAAKISLDQFFVLNPTYDREKTIKKVLVPQYAISLLKTHLEEHPAPLRLAPVDEFTLLCFTDLAQNECPKKSTEVPSQDEMNTPVNWALTRRTGLI